MTVKYPNCFQNLKVMQVLSNKFKSKKTIKSESQNLSKRSTDYTLYKKFSKLVSIKSLASSRHAKTRSEPWKTTYWLAIRPIETKSRNSMFHKTIWKKSNTSSKSSIKIKTTRISCEKSLIWECQQNQEPKMHLLGQTWHTGTIKVIRDSKEIRHIKVWA